MLWLIIMIISVVTGLIGQFAVNTSYKKWAKTPSNIPLTGADMARQMLASYGEHNVVVNIVPGSLSDYFDPQNKTLNLSQDTAYGHSVAAHAVACHEAGHYLQFCQRYFPLRLRHAMVPIVNASQWIWMAIMVIGISVGSMGLIDLSVAIFALGCVFSLITLPVEFNASKRAIKYLDGQKGLLAGYQVSKKEQKGTRQMLRSAALTYVMSALASVLSVILVLLSTRN